MNAKRFWLCLILGTIAGLICAVSGNNNVPEESRQMVFISVVLNRAFIGFVIGISGWKMHWAMHGIIIGILGSLPLSVPLIFTPDKGTWICMMYTMAGAVWGFGIELITSVAFKAKIDTAS